MASNKYILMLGLISLFSSAAFGQQNDAGYDWRDSSKIPTKSLPQQSEFLNNQYPYPAKPRSMWELGFAGGNNMVVGDIRPKMNVGGAITLRKAVSHTFSFRFGYFGGYAQGYPNFPQSQTQPAVRAFQNWKHSAAVDVIASLNPNSHYRGNPKTNVYVLGGLDLIATKVFTRGTANTQIDGAYGTFYGRGFASNQTGIFRTFGGSEVAGRKGWALLPGGSAGAGIAFKLSPKVNIGLEQRFTFVNYDFLDGYEAPNSRNFDMYSFTSARLNLNLGSTARRVQPLWWSNANNFVYNEINRPQHMKLPTPVLPDADGDGVTDQFDMEPNTPAGAPVDARGVAKDTDADGVPDYKDKELLTAQKCFPVDADGVGNCPEPACCTELRARIDSGLVGAACNIGNLPSIQFRAGRATLSKDAMTLLASAAAQIKATPDCRVRVIGHGASDKRAQQLSWDRVNSVIRYLVERQGISEDRFIFSYGEEGDLNTVDLMGTKETGPNTVPAPHPNLKGR
ncbi:OmpA family protein [Segetibacter sp.]|jgi:OOP family OmpA-OmpF porin|uniref:OmpA family protein n=1 Tax=Segetibacter sp. TaxID=2231182 RepID=UPI002638B24C|nr:OmpA family protein [Segetibacter sp.]MCW3079412.1 OmpA/MotB domain protein [Segetibacter sp.]